MRVGLILICVVAELLQPAAVEGQRSDPPGRIQLSALVSRLHYRRGSQNRWRWTSALRFRAILHNRFSAELTYTTPFMSEGPVYCPGLETCPPEILALDDKSKWPFSLLSATVGIRHPIGRWVPYVGTGGGRLTTEDRSLWGWTGYLGAERYLSRRFGMVFEFRVNRVDWPSEGLGWNQEAALGLGFAF